MGYNILTTMNKMGYILVILFYIYVGVNSSELEVKKVNFTSDNMNSLMMEFSNVINSNIDSKILKDSHKQFIYWETQPNSAQITEVLKPFELIDKQKFLAIYENINVAYEEKITIDEVSNQQTIEKFAYGKSQGKLITIVLKLNIKDKEFNQGIIDNIIQTGINQGNQIIASSRSIGAFLYDNIYNLAGIAIGVLVR